MTRTNFAPIIKWPGSKRTVAAALAELFPRADRFFDPFVGGGAVLPYRVGMPATAGDVIPELVGLWTLVRDAPADVAVGYEERWTKLQAGGHTVYYEIRERFNRLRDPLDLLFLSRTCVNGLIRFNARGGFNNSLHHTRPGIAPSTLARLLVQWSSRLQDVQFVAQDYRETLSAATASDFVFLDPPYAANKGRYQQTAFDVGGLFAELERLNSVGARWILTFDGTAGGRNYAVAMPDGIYRHLFTVETGNSPFPRLQNARVDLVSESLFMNFEPPVELPRQLDKAA